MVKHSASILDDQNETAHISPKSFSAVTGISITNLTNISITGASFYGSHESLPDLSQDALLNYPFTTSQLEAAYLSNQLLRLHPEEFRKLISLERSRQATLRWQFSSDPFDSVHEHQDLPYEMALLASEEPRIMQGTVLFVENKIINIQQYFLTFLFV